MNARSLSSAAIICTIQLSGCSSNTVIAPEPATKPGPSIAVVSSASWVFEWGEYDENQTGLNECLEQGLAARNADVVSQHEFMTTLFPGMSLERVPRSPEYIAIALRHPDVQTRLAASGIEYIVHITGELDYENPWGIGQCMGNAGCWSYYEEYETSEVTAIILDTRSGAVFGQHSAEQTEKSWSAFLGYVAIWYDAKPHTDSCAEVADNIYTVISAESHRWNQHLNAKGDTP